jgi:hypothetical protein
MSPSSRVTPVRRQTQAEQGQPEDGDMRRHIQSSQCSRETAGCTQTSKPRVGFEHAIPVSERAKIFHS